MELFIIDTLGPFFRDYKNKTINWSRIPFENLESNNNIDKNKLNKIRKDFSKFIDKISKIGYNAITIDNLAHLIIFDFYPETLKLKIKQYQQEYIKLFKIAKKKKLKIFVNTDVMFFNKEIENFIKNRDSKIISLLKQACEKLFANYPVDGVIMRIGESDGVDVKGDLLSKLVIKTPKQANNYLKELLPIFKKFNKYLIFRTWTIGAYKIGDLIWNKKTFEKTFKKINSKNLIISMKYGETDFFRGLELNPLFFYGNNKKIIELQTKREYDGFGMLPYYTGWDYEDYFKKLKKSKNLVGVASWCQSGGWSKYKTLTFIENSSIWNELNTYSNLKIFKDNYTANQAIISFFKNKKYIEFLKKYNELSYKLMYIKGFSDKELYFRRLRIPSLLWIWWNNITINSKISLMHQLAGKADFNFKEEDLDNFLKLGKKLKIGNINFYYETLKILLLCRKTMLNKIKEGELMREINKYKNKYPDSFEFSINLSKENNKTFEKLAKLLIRERKEYRLIDKLLMSRFLSYISILIINNYIKNMPKFVNKQAMNIDIFFR